MKKLLYICILLAFALCGCSESENKEIKLAVLGDIETFYPDYKKGIEFACEKMNEEYSGTGYTVSVEFYDDDDEYEKCIRYADELSKDNSVTAIISPIDNENSATVAKLCDTNEKLYISPFFQPNTLFDDNNYQTAFSLANSAENVGKTLRIAASENGAKRIAVCTTDSPFELEETQNFIQSANDDIEIADIVNYTYLKNNFDNICNRWDTLSVDSVAFFITDNTGFEIVKKLKQHNPELILIGDTSFDNSELITKDEELLRAMTGFIYSDEFFIESEKVSTDEENEFYNELYSTGDITDTWFIQGYNTARIVGDTAVKNNTVSPLKIADGLHKDGYSGFLNDFYFEDNGLQKIPAQNYIIYNSEGYGIEYYIEEQGN